MLKIMPNRQRERLSYKAVRTIAIFCLVFLGSCSDRKPDVSISSQSSQQQTSTSLLKTTYPKSYPLKLQTIGEFHGNEVQAKSGEQWLGLFATPKGFELLPTKIMVNTVRDYVIDLDETKKTGKKVITNQKSQPIFLVKGAAYLKPGIVKTVFSEQQYLTPNKVLNLSLNSAIDGDYQIAIEDKQNLENKEFSFERQSNTKTRKYIISVSDNSSTSQNLQEFKHHYSNNELPSDRKPPSVFWAGDLDRDGKLDLLIELASHANVSSLTLLLSSPAKENKLLEPVAQFVTQGC